VLAAAAADDDDDDDVKATYVGSCFKTVEQFTVICKIKLSCSHDDFTRRLKSYLFAQVFT